MKPTTRRYYAELKADYADKIRQLVPKYDEMVECIVQLIEMRDARGPNAAPIILDIGAGIGNLTAQLLERVPTARLTALEPSEEMYAAARQRLGPFGDRVELVQRDVRDYRPTHRYDAVISNLVLHNINLSEKRRFLESCRSWLEPLGYFIWGDLIRYPDLQMQAYFVERRKAFARERGCSEALVRWNFEKEATDDHPLTIEETIAEAKSAGFETVDLAWAHDTFAVFLLTAQPPSR